MELTEAISIRCSRRTYIIKPIENDKIQILKALVDEANKKGNLHLQLILQNGGAFQHFGKSYGMFSGVENYIALIGKNEPNLNEKLGYYGEKIVLEATRLGLGTCWVGGTFDRASCPCAIREGEIFRAVITIGNVAPEHTLQEKLIIKATHRKTKPLNEFYESDGALPKWFLNGIECAAKAPSAMNKQPVKFYYKDSVVTAKINEAHDYEFIDLGIAKLHFEIGAGGSWEWGSGAAFKKS